MLELNKSTLSEIERRSQYNSLNEKLSITITNTIVRHNIICNIIDNNEYELIINR